MTDWVLIAWIFTSLIWDVVALGFTAYMVFYKGHSGWWFALAIILCSSDTLYEALRKRYSIEKKEET